MAKARTNLIIEEREKNLLRVWTLVPAGAKKLIEAIEGVVRVFHYVGDGCLNVWLNPCYSKAEIKAEIRAALSERRQLHSARWYWERLRKDGGRDTTHPRRTEKTIADMELGEVGYVVPWAVGEWTGSHTLGGLNLDYRVRAGKFGTADTLICRTETGWVVGGQVLTEKAQDVFGGTIGAMRPGEAGYIVKRAFDSGNLDKRYTVFRYPVPPADTHICRTGSGWVVGGKLFPR